ncbi:MAG: sulfatase-like hydrolase/transferase [Acidobacteriia bacterium]|nr:sulfatase-like hydrolase/transferase [Terriglobia bacterium]
MLRRQFLQSLSAAAAAQTSAGQRPPNFIFLLSDDLGYGDLGCYGSQEIKTPHIDRLAREGTRFTDCYANGPVCTPTRTAFLTGRYQQRFGAELEWAIGVANNKKTGLKPSETVLPRAFKPAGYRSAVFGKWHVGWNPEFRPLRHGFDESYGILLGNADMYTHKYHDGSDDLWENDQPVKQEGYLTELLARKAVSFIDRNAANPFFLYLPFNAVHWPFQPPNKPESVRTPANWRDGERSEYVGMAEGMDDAVGQVMSALRRNRLDNNTLVVFTNDNGGERLSDSGSFFHTKSTLFEGGIRVPAIARWPGRIPAGRTSKQTAMTMDFTATFLAAAGVKAPDDIQLDGTDLMPVLSGRMPVQDRTLCWRIQQAGRRQLAVRRGRWKYIDDNTTNRTFPELLFDLEEDPSEHKNVFYKQQGIASGLRKAGLDWEASVQPK